MRKKLMCLTLVFLLAAALALPASADILWEPTGNLFYETHRDECDVVNRAYGANGEKGYISVLTAPNSLTQVANLANGTTFRVVQVWTARDGTQWGSGYSGRDVEGWVKMSEVELLYDYIAFSEDHGAEFVPYDGCGDGLTQVCLYSYPGGSYSHVLEESKSYQPFADAFTDLYTDGEGRRWTFVGYYMGRQNGWACIDDPMNEALGTESRLTVSQVRSGGELLPAADRVPAARTWAVWLIPAGLIVAAAGVTAVILRKRRKKA